MRVILLGVGFSAMWSSAFSSARIIVEAAPPLAALSLRFMLSGLIAIGLARLMGQHWNLTRAQWRATFLFGICQNTLYLGMNFVAMQWVPAGLAAIIASCLPLLVALAGWVFFRETIQGWGVAGLFAGLVGVTLIMGARISGGVDLVGLLLCILGVISLTVATLALKGASSGGNFLMVIGLQMVVGSLGLALGSLALSESLDVIWSWKLGAAFAYTTLVPGLAATFVWFTLVNQIGTVKASTFHFLNPFLGVLFAALVLGESLGGLDLLGVLIITGGILAVQLSKQNPTRT